MIAADLKSTMDTAAQSEYGILKHIFGLGGRQARKIVGKMKGGRSVTSHECVPGDIEAGQITALAMQAYHQGSDYLIVSSPGVEKVYIDHVENHAETWLSGRSWAVLHTKHLLAGSDWKVPITEQVNLPAVLICRTISAPEIQQFRSLSGNFAQLADRQAVHVSVSDLFYLSYKFSKFYSYVSILVSDECNLACTMCMFHSKDDNYGFKSGRRTDREKIEIKPADVYLFIDKLPPNKPILFSSAGEFLRAKNAVDYVRYAVDRGHPVVVGTNGSYLNDRIATQLIDLKVHSVALSVDSYTKEGYERVRVNGKWSALIRNIENLKRRRDEANSAMVITANCVLFDDIRENKDACLEFWSSMVDSINFMVERIDYLGAHRPGAHLIEPPQLEQKFCFSPIDGPHLLSNGDISPCCEITIGEWFEKFDWLSNINSSGIDEAVDRYKKMMLDPKSPLSDYCSKCSWWASSYTKDGKSPFGEQVALKK